MTARGRRVTAAGRDLDREAAGEPQRPPPSSALALSLQAGLGNRLTTQIIQRALLGQPRSYEQQNAEQARDRQEVDAAVREAALIEDQRMRNTARVILSGRATLYVGTPRWNSDALVSDGAEADAAAGHVAYLGVNPKHEQELYGGGGELRQPRLYERHTAKVEEAEIAHRSTAGYSDGKSRVTVLGPTWRGTGRDEIKETLRHEVQHMVDENEPLMAATGTHAPVPAGLPAGVQTAMDKGLAQFLTEQRAYSLEGGGGSLFNVGVNPEYANDPARPHMVRMLVGSGPSHIPQATADEALRPDLLPGGAALAAGYWADAHRSRAIGHGNVPSGNAALVRQLLTAGDYLDFTAAWLLDDIHANGDARPFQQRVLTLVPAFVNPLNSPRILDVTRAIRATGSGRLREDDEWAELWTEDDPPKPNMLFTKALVALDGDELAFLAASPAFKQLLGARSSQDVVAGFEKYAAGLAPTYDRLRKARATLGKL